MKLAQLLAKERTLDIDIDGDTLNVTYRPSDLTPELEDRMQASFETNRPGGALAKYLSGLLIGWDLEGEDGVIPLTPEGLAILPIEFLNTVAQAVIEDSNPKKTNAETSLGGSRQKAK